MKELLARTPKQLDLCLRLLYAENMPFTVRMQESDKGKIEYVIVIDAENQAFEDVLREKYRILIS